MTYTPAFRQCACLALRAAGYPTQRGALNQIARLLDVPRHTLHRWYYQVQPHTLDKLPLTHMLNLELQKLFTSLDRQREQANYAQLSRALAQLVDAMQHVENLDQTGS